MHHAHYIAAVARALRDRALRGTADPAVRNVLETSIRTLAGIADALESERELPCPASELEGPPVTIAAPPESAAARSRSGSAIRNAARRIELSGATQAAAGASTIVLLDWERALMQQANLAMLALETPDEGSIITTDPLIIRRESVEAYFRNRFDDGVVVSDYFQAIGGRSRQTVVFKLHGNTGIPSELVLQRDHPGGISHHGVADEFPVLRLLAGTRLKGPRPVFLETSAAALGAPFMVSERSPGKVAGPDYWNPPRDTRLALQLAEQLAILHAIDYAPVQAGLRHTLPEGVDWQAELAQVEARWNELKHWDSVAVSAAFAWMRRHVGEIGTDTAIVHNDTALHNVLVHEGEISALLDWELVHIGHPAEDLGYCRQFVEQIGNWDAFVDAYVAAGGKRYSRRLLDYFSLRAPINLLTLLQLARLQFENKATDDLNMAEVGASFIPKLMLKLADVLACVLRAE